MTSPITFTLDQLMSWHPCPAWPQARILALAAERSEWTLREALACEEIPAEDRHWLAVRALPAPLARLWAADCALRALLRERTAGREPDPRSWEAGSRECCSRVG